MKVTDNKQEQTNTAETTEAGFIDKLMEMFKFRHILRNLDIL